MPKNVQSTTQLHSFHTCLQGNIQILQARIQQYVNRELPHVQAGFREVRGTRHQIADIRWIIKKQESSRKTSTSTSLTTLKPVTVWIIKTVET